MTDTGPARAASSASGTAVDTNYQAILSPQCPLCMRPEQIIWVHGHGQCAHCHTNVMPCCDGAMSEDLS